MAEHCPRCPGRGCPGIVSSAVEQAAATAADVTRRKIRPEKRDQVYHAIIGLCNTLAATGKYLGDGRELAIQLSGLVVGDTKITDALERVERKTPPK